MYGVKYRLNSSFPRGHHLALICLLKRFFFPPWLVFGWPTLLHQTSPCYSPCFAHVICYALGQVVLELTSGTALISLHEASLCPMGGVASEGNKPHTPHFLLPSLESLCLDSGCMDSSRTEVFLSLVLVCATGALKTGSSHVLNAGDRDGTQTWEFWYSAFTSNVQLVENTNGHINSLKVVVPCIHKALNIAICHVYRDHMLSYN